MSYRERQPKWFRDDGNVNAVNLDTETIKVHSYHDFERRFAKQPMQIWATFKPKSYNFEGTQNIPIDITGSYPSMFNFSFTADGDITDDIIISDGTNTITIHTEVPDGSIFELNSRGQVKIDGQEIRHIYDQEQPISNLGIQVGVADGNKKIMQIFSPDDPDLLGIEIKFNKIVGAQDSLTVQLYELDSNKNLNTLITESHIENAGLQQYASNPFLLVIPFNETLDITKDYAFIIKRHSAHSDIDYFLLAGKESYSGKMKYWDGKIWINSPTELYFKTISPVTKGDLPIVNSPTGEITTNIPDTLFCESENLELDKIFVRSTAHPIYPLRKMQVFLDDGTLLKTKEFKKREHQYCYMMTVTAQEIADLGITIEELPFKVYLETSWYYFEHAIRKGFPQSSTDENPDYWPNEKLDMKANEFSLFRRKYRTDILPYEYIDTYPIGYPFPEEQDYWLEKRVVEEEATRTDANKNVYLYDNEEKDTKLVELRSRIPGIHDIEVTTYLNDSGESRVKVVLTTREKEILVEDYLFTDSITFMDNINDNSKILIAIYLNNATSLFLYNIEYIKSEGVYPTYGLIRSEIYSYLGVIPTIKDMVDYCLVYDRKTWDNFVWSGDIYSPAVFRIDIPKPPSNFKWLTHDEIKTIIKRCKKVGTEVLSTYSIKSKVSCGVSMGINPPEISTSRDFKLGIRLETGDANINLHTSMSAYISEMQIDYGTLSSPINISPLNISLDTRIGVISEAFSQDTATEFAVDTMYHTKITGTGSTAYIQLDNSTILDIGDWKTATLAMDVAYAGATLGWSGLNTITTAGSCIATNHTGSDKATKILKGKNFGITGIPDDAIITGIKVKMAVNPGLSGGGTTGHCKLTAGVHNSPEEKTSNVPMNWNQVSFGDNTSLWSFDTLKGSDVNDNNLEVDLSFNPVHNNLSVEVDWIAVYIYYRYGSGTFTTSRISLA